MVHTGPFRSTNSALQTVLEELAQREPNLHRPEFSTTRRDFETMTESNFGEGRQYGHQYMQEPNQYLGRFLM